MLVVILLLTIGIFLSAFFSGHETGFYRVTKLRLVISALQGSGLSKGLLWIANRPTLFVATTLVGNNLANHLTSLAVVLGVRNVVASDNIVSELVAPIALSPILFVYGELLPKYLFYQAPFSLLKRGGPLFLGFAIILAPLSVILWGLGRILELIIGQSPNRAIHTLAREELRQIFEQGHEAGVLRPAQRELAYNLVSGASHTVANMGRPIHRFPTIGLGSTTADAIRLAKRNRLVYVLVTEKGARTAVGYVATIDLHLSPSETIDSYRPLIDLESNLSLGEAILTMRTRGQMLARIVNTQGEVEGLVTADQLIEPLLIGDLSVLRR